MLSIVINITTMIYRSYSLAYTNNLKFDYEVLSNIASISLDKLIVVFTIYKCVEIRLDVLYGRVGHLRQDPTKNYSLSRCLDITC
jgi:hypothetical protein